MNELVYNIKLAISFIIIVTFLLYWNMKLEYENQFHTNDFVRLNKDFQISTGAIRTNSGNIIFLTSNVLSKGGSGCLTNIPEECLAEKKYSIKCLAQLKEKGNGFYNGNYFRSSDLKCR